MSDSCMKEAVAELRNEGFAASKHTLQYAIQQGYVKRPHMDGSLQYRFTAENLEEIREYLRKPRKAGRKPSAATEGKTAANHQSQGKVLTH